MALMKLNNQPSIRELRQFACLWGPGFCLVLGIILSWQSGIGRGVMALWVCALLLAAVGYVAPIAVRPVFRVLNYLAFPIGWCVSHLVLVVIYYGVFTPVGLIMRLAGRDPLERTFDNTVTTYWIKRKPVTDWSRYFQQF